MLISFDKEPASFSEEGRLLAFGLVPNSKALPYSERGLLMLSSKEIKVSVRWMPGMR